MLKDTFSSKTPQPPAFAWAKKEMLARADDTRDFSVTKLRDRSDRVV